MVSSGSWRDHFKIDDSILSAFWDEFSESSPMRASEFTLETAQSTPEFVLWCVRERHFTEQAFIEFQSEQQNLPTIRPEFFATPIDRPFWERVKDLHPWSASCFPLSDWDGHLLVATVWSDMNLRISTPHSFVLGTPTGLREFYTRLSDPVALIAPLAPTPPPTPTLPKTPAFDSGDPFAALSRELGLLNDEPATEETTDATSETDAPEGLFIPEGLSFSIQEVERLGIGKPDQAETSAPADDASDAQLAIREGGTLVHNFENGSDEVVDRQPAPREIEISDLPALSFVQSAYNEMPFAPSPPPPPPPIEMDSAVDLDVTQPSFVNHAAPVMPFAPIVTPEAPAMVKPPKANVSTLAPASTLTSPVPANAFKPESPAKPVAEATIVVNAADALEQPVTTGKIRKPLFEPSGDEPAAPPKTASGTQTGTKSRKLEAPPVTSFYSGVKTSSRVRNEAYVNHAISISKIEPIHLDQCISIDEAGAQALLQASNLFETAMILLFKDGELQPWKWSDLFLSIHGENPQAIELDDPSIFKIVFRTAKPYHGYVVTSATNQKFFNEFYRGMLPKHATVIPIMIDGRMGGMLLAFTNSKIEYRQSLRLMERLSFDLARVFKNLRGTLAKAS